MFDKGYSHKAPLTFKLNANTSYNLGFNYKGDFVRKDDNLDIDWECKFRHHKPSSLCSILFSNLKSEAEAEFWSLPKRYSVFKAKLGIMPKGEGKKSEEGKGGEMGRKEPAPQWDVYTDAEVKYHGIKHFYGAVKLMKNYGVPVPTAKITGVYKIKPQGVIIGANCTVDSEAKKPYITPLELLVGLMPQKSTLVYLKHGAKDLKFPGKFTAGLYRAGAVEVTWAKTKGDKVINKVYQYRVETAAEASIDMADENKRKGRAGFKVLTKKAITFQTMLDDELKWKSALTYKPSMKMNFVLSSQLDFAKFKKNKKGGFYDCGFTVELLC